MAPLVGAPGVTLQHASTCWCSWCHIICICLLQDAPTATLHHRKALNAPDIDLRAGSQPSSSQPLPLAQALGALPGSLVAGPEIQVPVLQNLLPNASLSLPSGNFPLLPLTTGNLPILTPLPDFDDEPCIDDLTEYAEAFNQGGVAR